MGNFCRFFDGTMSYNQPTKLKIDATVAIILPNRKQSTDVVL